MNKFVDHNNPNLKKGTHIGGYCVEKIVTLKTIDSIYYELEHTATGAKHIHVSNKDRENSFGVAFKTVPDDSTGVAHILEHTVLCGSEKYSVRDPFFSMLKRSLSTFMNAFTASDWTMYPFATQNKKDFYNLMDVYLDSVFFPKIDELSFKQEGHRLEIDDNPEGIDLNNTDSIKLVYKGVVYNEMKGAMSSPSQVMIRSLLNALYPSVTYSFNSGGDPAVIPDLTYGQLKAFHKRHYHPSNAFFYTYGNLPLKDHLHFIQDKILKGYARIDPETDVPSQPRWSKPKKVSYSYPLGEDENPEKKFQVCVAWLTADITDSFEVLSLGLLDHILLGTSAAPLRKALIDSRLGTTLCDGTGYDPDNKDTMFVCGLKDVKKSSDSKIEAIIFDVLENLASKGIDNRLIESAIHQVEFQLKEVTNNPYPYGIKLLLSLSGSWFHGGNPVSFLQFDDDIKRLRRKLAKGRFFENRIKRYFLDNNHRILFTLVPDSAMAREENKRLELKLDRIKSGMKKFELEKIIKDANALKQLQETKEDVSCLPTLEIKDIPPLIQITKETTAYSKTSAVCYAQPTSGIFYFSSAFGTGTLQKKMIPLVPFFCTALPRIGTKKHNYAQIVQLLDAYTGGVGLSAHARSSFDSSGVCLPFISFGGKCLARNQEKMFEIAQEILCEFSFSDMVRLKSILLEYRADLESSVIQNGHRLAVSLASRNFSQASALGETWHGIYHLQFIKKLTDGLTKDRLGTISDSLSLIGNNILFGNNYQMALIGEDPAISAATSPIAAIQNKLKQQTASELDSVNPIESFLPPEIDMQDEIPMEGWSTTTAVSFVASVFKTVRMAHKDAPALTVISKLLRSMYLHREIREKGGAYGGLAAYNYEDGLFCFSSYRDPHIVNTLNVFDKAANFLRSGNYSNEDVKEAVLQVCSEIDKPDTPGTAAQKAFFRKIVSLSDEKRLSFKKELLSLTRDKILKVAEKYFNLNNKNYAVTVISSEEKLKAANKKLAHRPLKLYRI